MDKIYYIAEGNIQKGPFTIEELRTQNLSHDTLIWKKGLPAWVKLSELPESIMLLPNPGSQEPNMAETAEWFAMIEDDRRIGPLTLTQLVEAGVKPTTPVWRNGMPDWNEASRHAEIMEKINLSSRNVPPYEQPNQQGPDFSQNPQYNSGNGQSTQSYGNNASYGQQNPPNQAPYNQQRPYNPNQYGQQQPYGYNNNGYRPQDPYNQNRPSTPPTNWLTWAIVSLITGFIFSCIGCIFGIIAVVQANKANNAYAAGNYMEGDRNNSNAKTMTIIAFVFAGLGLLYCLFIGFPLLSFL